MLKKSFFCFFAFVLMAALVAPSFFQTEPGILAQDEAMVLTSVRAEAAPALDGVADEAFWADAPLVEVSTRRGENESNSEVIIKSVYTDEMVYFLITYTDPTESYLRSPWQMQEDGTWIQLKDPEDKGGDNNLWYEDKFAIIWSINNTIAGFEESGCTVACHDGENPESKPYGNKYTETEGEMGDIWHWKSVRNLNQIHDQYLDSTRYSEDTKEAGRHSDPADSGGYVNNINEEKTGPAFMLPEGSANDGAPGYILDSEKVPFDPAGFEPGDMIPSIIISEFVGDGGDIAAGWVWEEGVWTLEFGRALETGSEFDVQFSDLTSTYYFAVATFDNAQVRHSYQRGVIQFVFEQ